MPFYLEMNNDIETDTFKQLQAAYEIEFAPITGSTVPLDRAEIMSHWAKKEGENNVEIYILYTDETKRDAIGFTVVNLASMISGGEHICDVAEFFVVPKVRRAGAGKWMAQEIFKKYPGGWEVRQLPELKENVTKFWEKVILNFMREGYGEAFESLEVNDDHWKGQMQRFASYGPTPRHAGSRVAEGAGVVGEKDGAEDHEEFRVAPYAPGMS